MSIYYYVVMKDNDKKRAIAVFLGTSISSDYDNVEQEAIRRTMYRLDSDIDETDATKNWKDMTIADRANVLCAFKNLDKLKYTYGASTFGSLYMNLKVWGLIEALARSLSVKMSDIEWEILDDNRLDELLGNLELDGYAVCRWY